MLTKSEASNIVSKNLPDGKIQAVVDYRGLYLFQVFNNEPGEEELDPFFSVDKETGEFNDFSIITDGNINEIFPLFQAVKERITMEDQLVEDFLEHHGIKGQKWGVITKKAVFATGRGVGRGLKKGGNFLAKHPKSTVVGVTAISAVATLLSLNRSTSVSDLNSEHFKKISQTGIAWKNSNGPWNYAIPTNSIAKEMSIDSIKRLGLG